MCTYTCDFLVGGTSITDKAHVNRLVYLGAYYFYDFLFLNDSDYILMLEYRKVPQNKCKRI